MNRVPVDRSKLSPSSRWFAERLFRSLPELAMHAVMRPNRRRPQDFDLLIEVPSPTGDPERTLVLWMEDSEPSLGFGAWHTHAGLLDEIQGTSCDGIIDTAAAILSDMFVLCYDVGGEHDGHCGVLDLRAEEALAEELTSKYSPGTVNIRSWGGSADRQVGLGDLG